MSKEKKEKIEKIEKRLLQIQNILVGARNKIIEGYESDGYPRDSFIQKYLDEKNLDPSIDNILLPHLYAFEIVMAPIGYLTAISKEISSPWTNAFLFKEVFKDKKFLATCKKLFNKIWDNENIALFLEECNYGSFRPQPYGNFWNYDAMAWTFGFAVDALDFLAEIKEENKLKDLSTYYLEGFISTFFKPEEIIEKLGEEKDLKVAGYYFSKQKFSTLRRNIDKSGKNNTELIKNLRENIHTRLAFAFSNRSVLAAYDIAEETIEGIPNLRAPFDEAGKILNRLADDIILEIEQYNKIENAEDIREMYYHISNFGILTSVLGFQGYPSKFLELKKYCREILSKFLDQVTKNTDFQKPLDIFIPQEAPIEPDILKENPEKIEYTLNIAFPVLIRSMANMFNKSKKFNIDVSEFESTFERSIDLFIEKYMPKEDGIFVLPDENGKPQFDLALTASGVEALNLCMGYYLNRWVKLGGNVESPPLPSEGKGLVSISEEEYENYETWKTFKTELQKVFDGHIENALKVRVEAMVDEKLKKISQPPTKFNIRMGALHSLLDIFANTEALKPKNEREKELQQLWHFLLSCTKAQDEIMGDEIKIGKLEKLKEGAVDQYFNPLLDSVLDEDRIKQLDKELRDVIKKKS